MYCSKPIRSKLPRRGVAKVQWVILVAGIVVVLFGTISLLGNRASNRMDNLAEGVGNPAALTKQFGKKGN